VTNIYIIPGAETNLVPWTAQNFFIAAADRMLKLYTANWYATDPTNYLITYYGYIPTNYVSRTGFGVTNVSAFGMTNEVPSFGIMNIPVRMNGNFVYTPAVNRVLQLAANLYDASTNSFYPSVFRPIFERDVNGNVFITGYTNLYSVNGPNTVRDAGDPQLSPPYEVALLSTTTLAPVPNAPIADGNGLVNVYGVPWIIGTKKYLPGLNQFSLVNSAQFIRKLQVARNYVGGPIWTNQMIVMSISNNLGISFWNPYTNDYPTNYPGGLDMSIVVNTATRLAVTNSDWTAPYLLPLLTTNYVFRPSRWPGAKLGVLGNGTLDPNSFIVQQWANQVVTQSVYSFSAKTFVGTDQSVWETNRTELDLLPQFGLLTTNWVQSYIVDRSHVIDYVQLRGPINNGNLNSALKDPNYEDETGNRYLWSTNIWQDGSTISWGIVNQIDISSTPDNPPPSASWKNPGVIIPGITDPREASWIFFGAILKPNSVYQYAVGGNTNNFYTNLELAVQAPYTATRTVYVPYLYQVNDPLVHYLVNDLDAGKAGVWAGNNVHANGIWDRIDNESTTPFPTPPRTEIIKGRYQPWGIGAQNALLTTTYNFDNAYNLVYKDPLIWSADSWSFLTNKYPTAGWVGRVHRGTPWQTVYLKAHNVLHTFIDNKRTVDSGTNTWMAWTGDYNILDAANSGPLQDRLLFDVFTTAPNDNATRGQLSVNQTHLAAWSALFSGMVVLSNSVPDILFNNSKTQPSNSWLVVSPAGPNGLNSALGNLVTNINNSRAIYTNVDGVVGTFEHKGDILSVVALTEQSPFLNWNNTIQQQKGISDEVYEWLPQQMMSLLKCPTSPRYVVYCYGQTLKPAPDSRVTSSGTYFGLVTNYQVVAESAARAVIRLDRHATAAGTNYTTTVESYNVLPPD
jgi:hypothetical protein